MKPFYSFVIFIGFLSIIPAAAIHAETIVTSDITTDTTWTLAESPYVVQVPGADEFTEVPLVIHAGAILTIEPGVVVQFEQYNGMSIEGMLQALGEAEQQIYFTSMLGGFGGAEQWMHLSFAEGSVGAFAHTVIEYGGQQIVFMPMTAIYNGGGTLSLDHVIMHHNGFDGYVQDGGNGTIAHSDIRGHVIGVRHEGGELSISDTSIRNNEEEGIFHRNGILTVTHSELTGNNIGISVQEEGTVTVSNSSLHNNEKSILNQSEVLDFEYDENGNPINVVVIRPVVPVDARNNWWGNASGPVVATSSDAAGDVFGSGITFIPFLTSDPFAAPPEPPEQSLGQQAANLAKQLVNEPYLWGGKGWDLVDREFVSVDQVKAGYNYWNPDANGGSGAVDVGSGLDCSGLVGWSYNRSADPDAYFTNNYIKFESADMQKKYGSEQVTEPELQPGDLLFFDWGTFIEGSGWNGVKDEHIDHVAVYVAGDTDADVVHARSPAAGIESTPMTSLSGLEGFEGFRRPTNQGVIAMAVTGESPVHLKVVDPDGNTIDHTTIVPSDEEYRRESDDLVYSVYGVDENGNPEAMIYSSILKEGTYSVEVTPVEGVSPTATYSLALTVGDQTVDLAQNEPVSDIPEDGYQVEVDANENISLTKTLNAAADTYIKSGTPNKNQGTESVLRVRAAGDNRAIVQFDFSDFPQNAVISSAKLVLNIANNKDNWGSSGRTVGAYAMTKDWTELGATWNCGVDSNTTNSNNNDCNGTNWEMGKPNQSQLWPYKATTQAITTIANGQLGAVELDVTNDVQNFVSNAATNHGWLIRKEKEGATGWVDFSSKEAQSGPKLVITYE